jgi:hypothetical protein
LTGFAGGRPEPQSVVRLFSFLVDKADVPVRVSIGDKSFDAPNFAADEARREASPREAPAAAIDDGPFVEVPLIALAHGRSGDKGDIANIGVLARKPEFVAALRRSLTPEAVGGYLAHFAKGNVERFEWPGLTAFNFLLHQGLGGGGIASLRYDPQGKAMAQILMDLPIEAPARWLEPGGLLEGWSETGAQKTASGERA